VNSCQLKKDSNTSSHIFLGHCMNKWWIFNVLIVGITKINSYFKLCTLETRIYRDSTRKMVAIRCRYLTFLECLYPMCAIESSQLLLYSPSPSSLCYIIKTLIEITSKVINTVQINAKNVRMDASKFTLRIALYLKHMPTWWIQLPWTSVKTSWKHSVCIQKDIQGGLKELK